MATRKTGVFQVQVEETVSQQMNRVKIIIGHIKKLGPAEKSYLKKRLNQVELKDY